MIPSTSTGRWTFAAALAASLIFGVALVAVVTGVGVGADHAVVVDDAESGDRLLSVPVSDGDEVSIEYTHSVHKSPVIEAYHADTDDRVLVSDRMVFSTYGAGMPSHAEVERTDDGQFVSDTEGRHEDLRIAPGSVPGHELVVEGERHDLVDLSDESAVIVRIEKRSVRTTVSDRLEAAISFQT